MREFDGITFGMDVQDREAFKIMKKHVFYRDVPLAGNWKYSIKVPCVWAKELAAVMGEAGWLVSEEKCMKTVRWGNSAEYYVIYEEELIPE